MNTPTNVTVCIALEAPARGTVGHTATLVTATGTITAVVDLDTDCGLWYLLPGANTEEVEDAEIAVLAAIEAHDAYEHDDAGSWSPAQRAAHAGLALAA